SKVMGVPPTVVGFLHGVLAGGVPIARRPRRKGSHRSGGADGSGRGTCGFSGERQTSVGTPRRSHRRGFGTPRGGLCCRRSRSPPRCVSTGSGSGRGRLLRSRRRCSWLV